MCDVDEEWESFLNSDGHEDRQEADQVKCLHKEESDSEVVDIPECSNLYISTKTKIAYLNNHIDLCTVFWDIPVIPYTLPLNGVVKKQMKIMSSTKEDFDKFQEKLGEIPYYEEHIITHIDNPTGRIHFKDTRKISIGLSKKDIMSYRSKKKSAFYNCFVLMLRIKYNNKFSEYHVKIFNTGKIEIPGVQDDTSFNMVLDLILSIIRPWVKMDDDIQLNFKGQSVETVLINSNFTCGYYIDREILFNLLKNKYNIQCIFDPCSYPGVQSKFYYNHDTIMQSGSQISKEDSSFYKNITNVSFMIFRTGSVLIVGKCNEPIITFVYEFVKNILITECRNIRQFQHMSPLTRDTTNTKKRKLRKKLIINNIT